MTKPLHGVVLALYDTLYQYYEAGAEVCIHIYMAFLYANW